MPVKKILYICVCLSCLFTRGQQLIPFVENFTKSEYNGDNQVWNVVQGNDNAMYFANHHYFLRYNGVKWEKYSLPNKTIIRSVFVDGNKVYCGSYKEFGYWERIDGRMQYISLSKGKNLFLGNADNEEIWKIFKHKGKFYFQSFNEIYVYDGKDIKKIKFPAQISYCYVVDGKIYVACVRIGMHIMEDEEFYPVNNWPQLRDNVIHGMEKNNGRIYVFTKNNGVYIGDENKLSPWQSPLNELLKNDVLVSEKFLNDSTLIIGTGLQGLYIIDITTGKYVNINRGNALKNNAVLSIATDKENDLWLGLDNGISHIEVNSPVSIFSDNSGRLGSVYSLATTSKGYLFVTNHGIFTSIGKELNAVPNSQGQVWDIYKNGEQFVIGHNDGTFVYEDGALHKANPVNGGWKFLKSEFDNAYFQANYSGIAVYKDINNLSQWKILDSITKPIRNIAQNKKGELWAADNYRSLYRILYNEDFTVKKVENISRKNNIESDYGVKLFNFRGEVLFLINNTWYVYNSISGRLEKNKTFNASFRNISDIIPVDDDSFLILKKGLLYLINQSQNGFVWKLIPEKYYQGKLIIENIKVFKDGDALLINLDDGFIAFEQGKEERKFSPVLIEAYYQGKIINDDTKIKYNQSVEVNLISKYFGYNKPDLYYKFNDSPGYEPIKGGILTLNNLSSGSQELEVFYNDGKRYKKVASYNFNVARPWYFSLWMVLAYIAILSLIFFLYYRWNKIRYNEKIKLNEEELKHRREILELEMEAEKKLREQEYEKHRLEVEVQNKASEVAGKSLSIAKHSEMIESIQQVLESENSTDQLKQKIKKIIKTNSLSKNEWQSFEKNLIKSHEEFVERLTAKYPFLTPKDIKLCIYLKMNLSSKEIAPLMNISYRGVELHRYRLRKKMEIPTEENLSKFMITV
ncbi:histidine kinase [Flavobacterium sp. MK4S-17]|uniref:histidine kinase n=1 Tax=Flavobacterium sp. MK4S-17 TaxID=2543737 RepID=UPI0013592633|nr:histidine kinase [Flavobacterium sp. MK4S-17]